jgi:hypothetical protein
LSNPALPFAKTCDLGGRKDCGHFVEHFYLNCLRYRYALGIKFARIADSFQQD